MKYFRTHKSVISTAFAALVFFCASTGVHAETLIPITNPGFESTVLNEGLDPGGAPGWSEFSNVEFFGAWNPTTGDYPQDAPEGSNICYVSNSEAGSGLSQVLPGATGTFQANVNYTLKVRVGHGNYFAYDGYLIQLVVNNEVIAQDDNSLIPDAGSFVTSTINYSYNAGSHAALVGQPMEIRLLCKGFSNTDGATDFDDVRLSVSLPNPIAAPGGPYVISSGYPLILDGSGSLPSDGNTITKYEWDLNNDNTFGDIPDSVNPSAIPYTTLTSTWGMVLGDNTIQLRVTDSDSQISTVAGTVTLTTPVDYIGPTAWRSNDRWNQNTTYWSNNEVPSGPVDVFIPDNWSILCENLDTPTYTGNLYIGLNSKVTVGWVTPYQASYNCFGTPGSSTIFMSQGSSISMRLGGKPLIPAIQLNGDATAFMSSSTGAGAEAQFSYPITGPHRFYVRGNRLTQAIADLNTANSFSELYGSEVPYANGGCTVNANAAGSLGTGNVTIETNNKGGGYINLHIEADNAMSDTGTLSIDGDSDTKLWMNGNDTIGALIIQGVQLAAGTYGPTVSAADYPVSWIDSNSTGILTVANGPSKYWDINSTAVGAGGATPNGTWDSSTKWSSSAAGTSVTNPWVPGQQAAFAAGTDANGTYEVTVGGSSAITMTNSKKVKGTLTPNIDVNVTDSDWALNGGNAVVLLFTAKNVDSVTATYGGQAMTVTGAVNSGTKNYAGVAYIIDPIASTGDIVINAPYSYGSGQNYLRYAYTIVSLSNVASATSPDSATSTSPSNLSYTTTTNSSYVFGAAINNTWHSRVIEISGNPFQLFRQDNIGYCNVLHCYGIVAQAGAHTDTYSIFRNATLDAASTLAFNAKTTGNPLLSGQAISGLSFEDGSVTLSGQPLNMLNSSSFTVATGVTTTIASEITGTGNDLTKAGDGTLILSADNSYTGSTIVSTGTLQSGADDVLPNTSVIVSGNAAGITAALDFNNYSQTIGSLTLSGATTTSAASVNTGTGTLSLNGDITYTSPHNSLGATISGNLSLGSSDRTFSVQDSSSATNDLSIPAVISGTGGLTKSNLGTLYLSGANNYTGLTTVNEGALALSGSNASATGGITVNNTGVVRFDSVSSINGTTRNITANAGGVVSFDTSFGAANIPSTLSGRITASSAGIVAADYYASTDFNFGASGLTAAYLGCLNNVSYSGIFTPNGSTYRLGGGGGRLTLVNTNTVSGSNALSIGGSVLLGADNNLTGDTTILSGGRLQIGTGGATGSLAASAITNNGTLVLNRSDNLTAGTSFLAISGIGSLEKSGSGTLTLPGSNSYTGTTTLSAGTLILDHNNAIGTGGLTINSGTLDATSPLTLATNNPVNIGGDFTFGGSSDLNFGTGPVSSNGNRLITLNGSGSTLTFGGVMANTSDDEQTITVNGVDNTLVLGGYELRTLGLSNVITGTANVTITGGIAEGDENYYALCGISKSGTGTLTLLGDNTYTGSTTVDAGVLALPAGGSQTSSITVNNGSILAFTLGNSVTSTESLTLNSGHSIRIIGTPSTGSVYQLMTASFIVGGAPTLETPINGWTLEVAGNVLQLTESDITPPLMLSIVDDQLGGSIVPNTLVTYTVTFNEEIDQATVSASDFDNAGTSTITIGTITQIAPSTFTLQVTPTTLGTLQLQIPTTADIRDVAGNQLVSDPALIDDTIITVENPYDIWAGGGAFGDNANGDGIANGLAWLLGASDVNEDATSLLPVVDEVSGDLQISFYTLDSSERGAASIKVQYSKDLGVAAAWDTNEAEVPDMTSIVNGIDFIISPIGGGYIFVSAKIPGTEASPGTTLFGRVSGSETTDP